MFTLCHPIVSRQPPAASEFPLIPRIPIHIHPPCWPTVTCRNARGNKSQNKTPLSSLLSTLQIPPTSPHLNTTPIFLSTFVLFCWDPVLLSSPRPINMWARLVVASAIPLRHWWQAPLTREPAPVTSPSVHYQPRLPGSLSPNWGGLGSRLTSPETPQAFSSFSTQQYTYRNPSSCQCPIDQLSNVRKKQRLLAR